jgi:hypothetical protein
MGASVIERESAQKYFRELVDDALTNQGLLAQDLTAGYVVQMLAGFVERQGDEEFNVPLAVRLMRAFKEGGTRQRASLRRLGDESLFTSGFFSDSLRRSLVDIDYYASIGVRAYLWLSRAEAGQLAPVFEELARKFDGFVDVISEVSERSSCTSNHDLLRLYERWLMTRSSHTGRLLVERGIVPITSLPSARRVQ